MISIVKVLCGLMLFIVLCQGIEEHIVSVKETESVSLQCPIQGEDYSFQGWYKMSGESKPQPVQISPDLRQLVQNGTLYFVYVEDDDAGVYKCAFNIRGKSTLSFHHTTVLKVSTVDVPDAVKPQLMSITPNTRVLQGGEVAISCIFAGKPIPNITWHYDGEEIATSLLPVSVRDEGNYTCVGRNTAGTDTGSMYLTVITRSTTPRSTPSTTLESTMTRTTPPHPPPAHSAPAADSASTSGSCKTDTRMVNLVFLLLLTFHRWL